MLDELHHFLLVQQTGSFTAAARRAHLSQPALSMSVARLEQAMGARLLDRERRQVRLTAAGEALLPHARAVLANVDAGRAAVQALSGLLAGEVRLSAGATAAAFLLPAPLAAFRARAPGVRLRLREASTRETLALLAAHEVELGVVVQGARLPAGVELEGVGDDVLVVVEARGGCHPRDADPSSQAPWIAFPPGTPTRALLDRHAPDADIAVEANDITAIVAAAAAGIGRALVPEVVVADALRAGTLQLASLPWSPQVRTLALAHRGVTSLSPAASALREVLLGWPRSPPR